MRVVTRAGALLFVFVLIGLLATPALWGRCCENSVRGQRLENRALAELPSPKSLRRDPRDYLSALGSYLNDAVGFRWIANAVYHRMKYYVLADPPLQNVSIGLDGHVFLNSIFIERPFTTFQRLCELQTDPLPRTVRMMDETMSAAARRYVPAGRRVWFLFGPTTTAIYPDRIPRAVPARYRRACLAYGPGNGLLFHLRRLSTERDYRLFYPWEQFVAHRDEPYFYPKERSHWDGRSTFLFARAFMAESGITRALDLDEASTLGYTRDDIAQFFGFSRPIRARRYPYARYELVADQRGLPWIEALCPTATSDVYRSGRPKSARRAILFSNSFGETAARHLAVGYREMVHVNLNFVSDADKRKLFTEAVERLDPDDVLFLFDDIGAMEMPDRLDFFVRPARRPTS